MPLKRSEIEKLKRLHERLMAVFRQLSSNTCQFDQVIYALTEFDAVNNDAHQIVERYRNRMHTLLFQLTYAHLDAPTRLMKIAQLSQYDLTLRHADRIIFNSELKCEMQRAFRYNHMKKMTSEREVAGGQSCYLIVFLDETILRLQSITDTNEFANAKKVFDQKVAELKHQSHRPTLFNSQQSHVIGFTNDISVDMLSCHRS